MYDLVSVGELLIDLFSASSPLDFKGAVGGAPCNLAAQAARLGSRVALVCKVGDDHFGRYLKDYVEKAGLDSRFVTASSKANTTLAFVSLDETGNRSFTFYRKPGADMLLEAADIPMDVLKATRCVSYGGVGLSAEPCRSAIFEALAQLDCEKQVIAYDPNLRESLWATPEEMVKVTLQGMQYANVVKLTDEELLYLTGCSDLLNAWKTLQQQHPNIRLCVITAGGQGAYLPAEEGLKHYPACRVQVVDTTGAGDSFFGALLHCICKYGKLPWEYEIETLDAFVRYANAAGGLTTTGRGAIASMPDHEAILRCLQQSAP